MIFVNKDIYFGLLIDNLTEFVPNYLVAIVWNGFRVPN